MNSKIRKYGAKSPGCLHPGAKYFKVPEEKRTDVNIAISMLDDAYQDLCDHLILFSGDSDLVPAVNLVRTRFPAKTITVYVPSRDPIRGCSSGIAVSGLDPQDLAVATSFEIAVP